MRLRFCRARLDTEGAQTTISTQARLVVFTQYPCLIIYLSVAAALSHLSGRSLHELALDQFLWWLDI